MKGELRLSKTGSVIVVISRPELEKALPEPILPNTRGEGVIKVRLSVPHLSGVLGKKVTCQPILRELRAYPDGFFGFPAELLDLPREILSRIESLISDIKLKPEVNPTVTSFHRLLSKQLKESPIEQKRMFYKSVSINGQKAAYGETLIDGKPVAVLQGFREDAPVYTALMTDNRTDKKGWALISGFSDFDSCKEFFKKYLDRDIQVVQEYTTDEFIDNLKRIMYGVAG